MLAIGLMSGTSLDGCDCVLVSIENDTYKVIDYLLYPYEGIFVEKVMRNLCDETAKLSEICSLNFEFGDYFSLAIEKIVKKNKLKFEDISFVASHGQTIWHQPVKTSNLVPSTLQIGSPSVISAKTGIKVVSNFRSIDIALGGEGAPLVPMSEYMLYKDPSRNVVLQNIGGISNITYIKKNASLEEIIAFDTGPGNAMINYFTNRYFGLEYDVDGKIAKEGDIIYPLYNHLITDEFITRVPPKSTGREKYSATYMEELINKFSLNKYDPKDIIRTITEVTIFVNIYAYKNFCKGMEKLIICGGGAHNKFIIERFKQELNIEIVLGNNAGIHVDAKEALAFVVLGHLTLTNRCGNVKNATGAKKYAILGDITKGSNNDEC